VYATPFRAHEEIRELDAKKVVDIICQAYVLGPLKGLDSGSRIEMVFRARAKERGSTDL